MNYNFENPEKFKTFESEEKQTGSSSGDPEETAGINEDIDDSTWRAGWDTDSEQELPELNMSPNESYSQLAKDDNRYISRNGGGLGWVDNEAVLESEQNNNYLYYTVPDKEKVRLSEYLRIWEDNSEIDRLTTRPLPTHIYQKGCVGYSICVTAAWIEVCYVTQSPPALGTELMIRFESCNNEHPALDVRVGVSQIKFVGDNITVPEIFPERQECYTIIMVFLDSPEEFANNLRRIVTKQAEQAATRIQLLKKLSGNQV